MRRSITALALCLTVLAVGSVAGVAWAQEASPTPTPTESASPTPSPTAEPSPGATPTPTPSSEPTSEPTPSPTPSPSGPDRATVGDDTSPGITLLLSPSTTALRVGDRLSVVVSATNAGPDARDLTLAVTVPDELEYVSSDPPGTNQGRLPGGTGDVVEISLGVVPPGGTADATVVLEAVAPSRGGAPIAFEIAGTETSAGLVVDVLPDDTASDGVLSLAVDQQDPLSEVGDRLDAALRVTNTGTDPLKDVIVVQRVAPELHVIAAPLAPGVDAVQVGRFLAKEDIVWVIAKLGPGESVRLPWRSEVQAPGDLAATSTVKATARRTDAVAVEVQNFLASPDAPAAPENPPFTPIRKRVALRSPSEPASSAAPAQGTLPFTGFALWFWTAIGVATALLGATLWRFGSPRARGKRVPAVALLLCIVTAACVSSSDRTPQAVTTPEVKGRRIERGGDRGSNPANDRKAGRDDEDASGEDRPNGSPDAPDADDPPDPQAATDAQPTPEPTQIAAPVPDPQPADDTTITYVTRAIGLADLPVRAAGSLGGTGGSFSWSEAARSVTSAVSARTIDPEQEVSVESRLDERDGVIAVEVSLVNDTDDERVSVSGYLVHEVSGGGDVTQLISDPIDTVLSPHGRATATFHYLLPSGTYNFTGSFVAE